MKRVGTALSMAAAVVDGGKPTAEDREAARSELEAYLGAVSGDVEGDA